MAYQRYWPDVFRFALAWTNDWSSAEDLAQEAFMRMWSHRADFDWSRPVLPWVLTIVRRLAIDRFRRIRRAATALTRHVEPPLDGAARVRWLDVSVAMRRLTPVQRASLVLTAIVGLDYDSAAKVVGTTPGAVRAAVSRARARLAEQ